MRCIDNDDNNNYCTQSGNITKKREKKRKRRKLNKHIYTTNVNVRLLSTHTALGVCYKTKYKTKTKKMTE